MSLSPSIVEQRRLHQIIGQCSHVSRSDMWPFSSSSCLICSNVSSDLVIDVKISWEMLPDWHLKTYPMNSVLPSFVSVQMIPKWSMFSAPWTMLETSANVLCSSICFLSGLISRISLRPSMKTIVRFGKQPMDADRLLGPSIDSDRKISLGVTIDWVFVSPLFDESHCSPPSFARTILRSFCETEASDKFWCSKLSAGGLALVSADVSRPCEKQREWLICRREFDAKLYLHLQFVVR